MKIPIALAVAFAVMFCFDGRPVTGQTAFLYVLWVIAFAAFFTLVGEMLKSYRSHRNKRFGKFL